MTFQIKYTLAAENDKEEAFLWVLEQSQSKKLASSWFNEISLAIETLKQNPRRCSLAPENEYFSEEIRQLLFGKKAGIYRILFTIEGENVIILNIRHSARKNLDLNRFKKL